MGRPPLEHITFSFATGFDHGVASSSSSTIAVSTAVVLRPAPPDHGFHVEAKIAAQPAPAPMLTTPLEFHHAPIDLVITAAAVGAIVAWHIRRARFDAYGHPIRL